MGDGLPPARENTDFSNATQKLSGTVCAVLGWTADQFWKATPAELVAIFAAFTGSSAGDQAAVPLDAEQLEKLKESFPDG
ncbi:phage tail assembly chaperone [Parasphingorhabdus sp.]|uniref:phage tail assembly chaperone n=1 Tax=Parasphingorhabdus sp. TaxID=2709688 RepID=UPI003A91A9F5